MPPPLRSALVTERQIRHLGNDLGKRCEPSDSRQAGAGEELVGAGLRGGRFARKTMGNPWESGGFSWDLLVFNGV